MFIPMTPEEVKARGWGQLDIVLVSGDAYIDSPLSGIAIVARQLEAAGYSVGVISQPVLDSPEDISRFGEPRLFWGISAGVVDSMVANYTALGKPRRLDDNTPGGENNRRPDRATIAYSNLIRKYFKKTRPILLGGIEASLRRVVHYDFWSNTLRRSILLDSKADYLLYGMADLSVLEFAAALRDGTDPRKVRGICYASVVKPTDYLELPSYEECQADKAAFTRMFDIFYKNNDPVSAQGLAQAYNSRYVVQNPPALTLTTEQLDKVYALPFEYAVHPHDADQGEVRAWATIKNSIVSHRGCYGECSFCAIAVHEGRRVTWRSQKSILDEAKAMTRRPGFTGVISDLSGPTANMYGFECAVKSARGACRDQSCLYPQVCPVLPVNHQPQIQLLKALREIPGVKHVFVSSGIRPDLVFSDANFGQTYLNELIEHHVSGQLKLAPEHVDPLVLKRMRKPPVTSTLQFKEAFDRISAEVGKEQYLSYYIIAAFPGCGDAEMINLQNFCAEHLGVLPEQVQIFTPTPSTYASLMYYTERDPFTGEQVFVEKSLTGKMQQKALITGWRKGREMKTKFAEKRSDPGKDPYSDRPAKKSRKPFRLAYQTDRSDHHKGYEPPRREAPAPTRVVRDDSGRFLHNQVPEGYIVRERKPFDRNSGNGSRSNTRRWGDARPEESLSDGAQHRSYGGQSAWERRSSERKSDADRREKAFSAYGDHPYSSRSSTGSEQSSYQHRKGSVDRPYRPHTEGSSKSEERRPSPLRTEASSEGAERRPYQRREGSPDRPSRAGSTGGEHRPYRSHSAGSVSSGEHKPYQRREGSSGRPSRSGSVSRPYSGNRRSETGYKKSGRPYKLTGDRLKKDTDGN